jgi:uncharacterized membrane protein
MKRFLSIMLSSMTASLILIFGLCTFYISNKNTVAAGNGGGTSGILVQAGLSGDQRTGENAAKNINFIGIPDDIVLKKIADYREKFYYFIPPPIRLAEKLIYVFF